MDPAAIGAILDGHALAVYIAGRNQQAPHGLAVAELIAVVTEENQHLGLPVAALLYAHRILEKNSPADVTELRRLVSARHSPIAVLPLTTATLWTITTLPQDPSLNIGHCCAEALRLHIPYATYDPPPAAYRAAVLTLHDQKGTP